MYARVAAGKKRTKQLKMKQNQWTLALLSAGLVTLPAVSHAEEKPSSVLTSIAPTTLSGYVDTSAQWNFGTGNANLPPYAFGGTSKADGFNLNVVKLTLEKPVDAADTWGAGYKVDLLFGPDADAFATQSSHLPGDFAIKQAYVSLHAPVGNGLDFKVGVWDTLIGYEVFDSASNPNFTRSYGYSLEPTTHTGVQASYVFCESFSANVGIADTYGPTINGRAPTESYKTYMGSFTFTAPTNSGFLAGSTLTACVINGFNTGANPAVGAGGNQTSYYVGGTVNTPVTGLKAGCAFDYIDVHNTSGETWVLGGYLAYQATEKLSFYGRAEYVRDRGDQKFFTTTDAAGDVISTAPDKVMEMTLTAQYDLWKNVLSRVELRWDHSLSGDGVWGGKVTGDGSDENAWMAALNIVYKF
jgi:hypothetical protein